jgi:hypothetical protein
MDNLQNHYNCNKHVIHDTLRSLNRIVSNERMFDRNEFERILLDSVVA